LKTTFAIILAIVGFVSSGPIGAIIGFFIGLYIEHVSRDDANERQQPKAPPFGKERSHSHQGTSFNYHLLILIAAIMNADGSAMKSELELVKRMLTRTYGEQTAQQMLLVLREMLKQRQDVTMVCRQIRGQMAYSQRLELMHVLFRISRADGEINTSEMQMLQQISSQMAITTPDFLSLRAMFVSSPDSEFQILEISATATEDEVKKAYRKMAMKSHPDRLQGLNETEKKAAEEKFLRVKKAYENIKRKKGWT
jgi:DnaJ like chaperone protein